MALACVFLAARNGLAADAAGSVARTESRIERRSVPDIALQLADGQQVRISSLWRDRPLLLTFFFRSCAGICTPFLASVRDAAQAGGGLDRDYRVLAVALDDPASSGDLRAQAASLGLLGNPGWIFATASREDSVRIARALDFRYRFDPRTGQYDHDAMAASLNDGRIVRAVLGTPESGSRIVGLVREIRGIIVTSYETPRGAVLRCLRFDPASGAMRIGWGMIVLAAPALGALVLAGSAFAVGHRAKHDIARYSRNIATRRSAF